ncbi:MAG: L,D-transpeptidase family protein [Inquilinus sp.]|nr:L,D-transpeptidase family protein [Inquilinus sp.]
MTTDSLIEVFPDGRLAFAGQTYRCALGRGGVMTGKREGDGATPAGHYPLRRVLYRPDRLPPPATALPVAPIAEADGWCDDSGHPAYNRPVALPFAAGHERLWREDGLYDVIVILGHNDDPPMPGRGSAIFFHVARPDHGPTEGCVALARPDLLAVLRDCRPGTEMLIHGPR